VPGDKIIGFITRGGGDRHAADCPNAEPALLDRERLVAVGGTSPRAELPVRILVESRDKLGILAAVTG
jgi:(p)ppGpp synthase/HD superfamily hydrolase